MSSSSRHSSSSETTLSDRAQKLLKLLIEMHIRDGLPVGSRALSREESVELSPASVRNVMADLEDLGLVAAPHTSAGRVPTVEGYRLFVDSLLTVNTLDERHIRAIEGGFSGAPDQQQIIRSASDLLSHLTSLAGVVMIPRISQRILRQIEYLPLSNNRVLEILVTNEQEVQNRILHLGRELTLSQLQQAANYLTQTFSGMELQQIRPKLVVQMDRLRVDMNELMSTLVEVAADSLGEKPEQDGDLLVAGETNLMAYNEMASVAKLRDLFDAFGQKRDILHLLDQSLDAKGVQIFIGHESGYRPLDNCSLVTAPYHNEDRVVGVLGVIGPTRMAYEQVIPIVDITAKLLGAALKQG